MTNALVGKILAGGLLTWLVLLALVLIVRYFDQKRRSTGYLAGKAGRNAAIQPERVAVIMIFPVVALFYAAYALSIDINDVPAGMRPRLPDVPEYLLALLTSGNTLYLAGKFVRTS